MRVLLRQQIESEIDSEWPAMAHRRLTLTVIPPLLGGALRLAPELRRSSAGQVVAQRELVGVPETALGARRQRIGISQSRVNWAKWAGIAVLALFAIAFVHAGRPATVAIALTVFATRTGDLRLAKRLRAVHGCRADAAELHESSALRRPAIRASRP